MSFWQFLNHWWNLPYLVMLGLVGVFFGLQTVGLAAHAIDGEPDVDVDGDGTADQDQDHDHDHDHDGESGVAAFLGVGRVPFMVIWLTFFIFAGFTGIFLNRVIQVKSGDYPGWAFPLGLLVSLFSGAVGVRYVARAIHKLVDTGGRGSSRRDELTGSIGVVASPRLDAAFGEVRVRDPRGNELIVHGHLAEGEGAALQQGARVVLVELKQDSGLFTVAALKE